MIDPLQELFQLKTIAWHPYLFWDLAADMHCPFDLEGLVARFIRDDELRLLGQGRLRAVLFSTSGQPRRAKG